MVLEESGIFTEICVQEATGRWEKTSRSLPVQAQIDTESGAQLLLGHFLQSVFRLVTAEAAGEFLAFSKLVLKQTLWRIFKFLENLRLILAGILAGIFFDSIFRSTCNEHGPISSKGEILHSPWTLA